jgi:hypothetical protein
VATPDEIRRRVMGWRAAERRERTLRAREGPLGPAAALDAAFELHELFAAASNAPDVVGAREVEGARAAWRKLRARLACRPATTVPH